jgi:uncharacterized protein (DUF433 family)
MQAVVIDVGRGPQIAGTRITVCDIMDYYSQGWHHTAIAARLRISSRQVKAAIEYIETHREQVSASYQRIVDRDERGNPTDLAAKRASARAKLEALLAQRRGRQSGAPEAETHPNGRAGASGVAGRGLIVNCGRGPQIEGTRITVYDIMEDYSQGWHHPAIAARVGLTSKQVTAAIEYIDRHRGDVEGEYQTMLHRDSMGNSPELRAKLAATHAKCQALWARELKTPMEPADARNPR